MFRTVKQNESDIISCQKRLMPDVIPCMKAGEPIAIKCLIVILDQITDSTLGNGFGLIHHLFSLKSVRTKFQHKKILQAGHRF